MKNQVSIEFSDVLWTVDENQFVDSNKPAGNNFKVLNEDIVVVQPVHIRYNWNGDDDYRLN